MKKHFFVVVSCIALVLMSSCSGQKGWKVSGSVQNAQPDDKVALQGFNGASWYLIDSIALDKNGGFSYSSPEAAPHADVYRLSYNGKAIYFPIDSIDAVEIVADASHFDSDYGLAGTTEAVQMMEIDSQIAKGMAERGATYVVSDSLFKRNLNDIILRDSVGVIAYYLINKSIGGQPLYSTNRRHDVKMIGAVANKFALQYPNDPRTGYLVERFKTGRQSTGMGTTALYEANVVNLFEIDLYDVNGQKRSLIETADNAGVTLLSFTSYELDNSVAYNVELNRLMEQFRPNNLAIYQVALDQDEVQWMQAAKNLPWIAVRQDPSNVSNDIMLYNITTIPVTFVINGAGELVERVDDISQLEAAIRRAL